jgi:GGDEF domain-containing protein
MGLTEAKRYIQELHKKQENPYLWPDYLTGLPDKSAIIRKLEDVFPKLGRYSIAYVRIANIHPYLIKYGPDKHADIIQWGAAVLKTTCDKCEGCFVGTLSTHDFILMCETKNMIKHIKSANKLFARRLGAYYTKEDVNKQTTLTFKKNGGTVNIGLMKLASVIVDKKPRFEKSLLIHHMGRVCQELERTDGAIVVLGDKDIYRVS